MRALQAPVSRRKKQRGNWSSKSNRAAYSSLPSNSLAWRCSCAATPLPRYAAPHGTWMAAGGRSSVPDVRTRLAAVNLADAMSPPPLDAGRVGIGVGSLAPTTSALRASPFRGPLLQKRVDALERVGL